MSFDQDLSVVVLGIKQKYLRKTSRKKNGKYREMKKNEVRPLFKFIHFQAFNRGHLKINFSTKKKQQRIKTTYFQCKLFSCTHSRLIFQQENRY